ncbi:DUF4465 domain-containing protein [Flavobacteriaceae bacterium F08102]|nr:DUF4465 domain-containing protein [Flavobacteriaceae bacterium F08102]
MKIIQKYIGITTAIISLIGFTACEDNLDLKIPYPKDINFNELTLDRFSYEIPSAPFTVGDNKTGTITVNVTGSGINYSGFALSNKNFRSYPWNLSPQFAPPGITEEQKQQSIDSTAFSVYTRYVNRTGNYLVGKTTGDNAYFTLEKPSTIEHVLVANTTYNYLLANYGSIYSKSFDSETQSYLIDGAPVQNPNIPNKSTDYYGTFSLPAPGNVNAIRLSGVQVLARNEVGIPAGEAAGEAALAAALAENPNLHPYWQDRAYNDAYNEAYDAVAGEIHKGYVKLTIEGFLNGTSTGTVEVYLSVIKGVDPDNPDHAFTLNDWRKVDLTSLGNVDKVLFNMSSDYVDDQGEMIYPQTFCLDGIRFQ